MGSPRVGGGRDNLAGYNGEIMARGWAVLTAAAALAASGCSQNWHELSRESAGIAPSPDAEKRAVVQAYAAAVGGWRGLFADHTWVATKRVETDSYVVYEVIGWQLRNGVTAVRIARDIPDRNWFGSPPEILLDLRGAEAGALIDRIDDAARRYPYADEYVTFPGPNSNTFVAWIAREVPELNLDLPLRAIGKSYPLDSISTITIGGKGNRGETKIFITNY